MSQAASSNTVRLAVLKDKQLFSSITGSITTATKTITSKIDHKEPLIVITDDEDEGEKKVQPSKLSSSKEQKMDTGHSDISSVEIGSQVASLKMSDSSDSMPSTSVDSNSGSATQFTLGMLSNALQNVNQSLGIAPSGNKQGVEETGVNNLQSDTDNCADIPEEKRPRLDTHEVITLKQDALPEDIHDKLHSNIR